MQLIDSLLVIFLILLIFYLSLVYIHFCISSIDNSIIVVFNINLFNFTNDLLDQMIENKKINMLKIIISTIFVVLLFRPNTVYGNVSSNNKIGIEINTNPSPSIPNLATAGM